MAQPFANPTYNNPGAQSLSVLTLALSNPLFDPRAAVDYTRINSTLSFTYTLTSSTIRTLSINGIPTGSDISGLLYTPDLPSNSTCINATAPYVPQNVTRKANLPDADYNLIALAPWLAPVCVEEYLAAAESDAIQGLIFFLPEDNSTAIPPMANSEVWDLNDGGAWKSNNDYPVYAIPVANAQTLLQASVLYSRNLTSVPFGNQLAESFNTTDYVRLFVEININGLGTGSSLPSLWVFLLIVLGILLIVIGLTSFSMHYLQRRRRVQLQRRIASGEVDLEALGIKRLTVPQEVLDKMPLYPYGSDTTTMDASAKTRSSANVGSKRDSASSSPPTSPKLGRGRPTPVRELTERSFRPTPLQQPTCAICLDDFVPTNPSNPNHSSSEEEESGTLVRELPCHHIFHPDCVDAFLRDNSSLCPLCKKTALPKGYCPRVVTNAMVRRERMVRRIRERVTVEEVNGMDTEVGRGTVGGGEGGVQGGLGGAMTLGERIRERMVGDMASWRGGAGRRVSSAPVALTEYAPPPRTAVRSSSATAAGGSGAGDGGTEPPSSSQPTSTPGRREWARQRALELLGPRRAAVPMDPEADDTRHTAGWRKVIRSMFPGFRG